MSTRGLRGDFSYTEVTGPPAILTPRAGGRSRVSRGHYYLKVTGVVPGVSPSSRAKSLSCLLATSCCHVDTRQRRLPGVKGHNVLVLVCVVIWAAEEPSEADHGTVQAQARKLSPGLIVSDRQDLNLRPLDPQSSALPNCATARSLPRRQLLQNTPNTTTKQMRGQRVFMIPETPRHSRPNVPRSG